MILTNCKKCKKIIIVLLLIKKREVHKCDEFLMHESGYIEKPLVFALIM